MVGITEAAAAYNGVKAAYDMAKGLNALSNDAKVKLATIDLMAAILSAQKAAFDAQEAQSDMLRRIAELEDQLADRGLWAAEAEKWRLDETPTGVQVYVAKQVLGGEVRVRLCPNCFESRRKSILQTIAKIRNGETVDCPYCKTRYELRSPDRQQIIVERDTYDRY